MHSVQDIKKKKKQNGEETQISPDVHIHEGMLMT